MNERWGLIGLVVLLIVALMAALIPLRRSKSMMILLTPILFCFVSFAYWKWGAWPDWQAHVQRLQKQDQVQAMLRSHTPEELIDRLSERLKKTPNSAQGWYLLGRLQASQHHWRKAYDAYAMAHQLKPENETITVNYAQTLWQLNHQTVDSVVRSLFQAVLKKNQDQPDALAMLAMDAYQGHAYQQAINYWERLLGSAPAQSEEAQFIRKAIAKAQQRLM